MRYAGSALVVIACIVVFIALLMDVGTDVRSYGPYGSGLPERVVNMQKMQVQMMTLFCGLTLFLGGIILIAADNAADKIRGESGEGSSEASVEQEPSSVPEERVLTAEEIEAAEAAEAAGRRTDRTVGIMVLFLLLLGIFVVFVFSSPRRTAEPSTGDIGANVGADIIGVNEAEQDVGNRTD